MNNYQVFAQPLHLWWAYFLSWFCIIAVPLLLRTATKLLLARIARSLDARRRQARTLARLNRPKHTGYMRERPRAQVTQ